MGTVLAHCTLAEAIKDCIWKPCYELNTYVQATDDAANKVFSEGIGEGRPKPPFVSVIDQGAVSARHMSGGRAENRILFWRIYDSIERSKRDLVTKAKVFAEVCRGTWGLNTEEGRICRVRVTDRSYTRLDEGLRLYQLTLLVSTGGP